MRRNAQGIGEGGQGLGFAENGALTGVHRAQFKNELQALRFDSLVAVLHGVNKLRDVCAGCARTRSKVRVKGLGFRV